MQGQKHVGFEIRTLSNLVKRKVDNLVSKKYGENLTGIQGWVIGYVYVNKNKEIFQKDIEEEFSIRRSTATTILKLMEKNGFITRNQVDYDGRLKKIELTEKAINFHEMLKRDIEKIEEQITMGLSQEEINSFFLIVEKIKRNL